MKPRHRQNQMGHQFGLHGLLCLRGNYGRVGHLGLPDVVWQTNDTGTGRNT